MDVAIEVHHDPFRRESLGTVAGDSVAVVEVPHLIGIEADRFTIVHLYGKLAVFVDALHGAEVAVGNTQFLGRSGKAQTVANSKHPLQLPVGGYSV